MLIPVNLGHDVKAYFMLVALVTLMGARASAGGRGAHMGSLPPELEEIRSGIVEKVSSGDLPSLSVMVFSNGEMIWEEAIGWADRENEVEATLESIYGLGSLSKSITATGMMVLVERGLVDLDAPVDQYLGEQKLTVCFETEEEITVRDLLLCAAGVPHGWYSYYLDEKPDFIEGDDYIRRFGLVAFPPGKLFLYSNHAYGIAREIIANVSSKSYEDFMREEVFEPLGMKSSGVTNVMTAENVALPYYGDTALSKSLVTGPVGGATLFSSASDIMRYARFHLGHSLPDQKRILSEETLRLQHTAPEDRPPGSWMALGWGVIELGSIGTVMISNGEVTGANATLLLLPKHDLAVVCLANKAFPRSISDKTAFGIVEALVPGFGEQMEKMEAEYVAQHFGSYEVSSDLLGPWKGEITSADGSIPLGLIFQGDGDIHVRVGDGMETLMNDTAIEYGLITGSCSGSLPGPEGLHSGHLKFYLDHSGDTIAGYLQWAANRIDSKGEEWPVVIPGCVTLSRDVGGE